MGSDTWTESTDPWQSLYGPVHGGCYHIPDVKHGDEVTLIGRDGDEFISIETFGDMSGRFSYEFACDISKRVPRVYIKDGREWGDLTFFK